MSRNRRSRSRGASSGAPRRSAARLRPAATAGVLFALALVLRWLYWRATPDRAWAYSAAYKGDSPLWLEWARALDLDLPFQLGLPLQPPGTAHLVSWLWDGASSTIPGLRALWCALGAAAVVLAHLAVRRSFGPRAALAVGLALAGSTGWILLSASIDSEVPYLVLLFASFLLHEPLGSQRPRRSHLALWALLQALACLVRVEHALYALLAWAWWLALWRRSGSPARALAVRSALVAGVALAALAPWQLTAWRAVDRLNETPPDTTAAEEATYASVERRFAGVEWTSEAVARRAELPAFARRPAALFVAATVAHRGGRRVSAEDLEILAEAFGSVPRPLPRAFLVSIYGGLNFAVAHHDGARGGFSTHRLEQPPPLAGGRARYPPGLVAGLPPPQLALTYPPHLELVTDGWRIGARWIAAHPGEFLRLLGRKLEIFWNGAALGLGGWNLPLDASGIRRAVDLVAPAPGPGPRAWQLGLLALAAAGLWRSRRRPELVPWLLYLAARIAVTLLFFGYARQGALALPVVALLAVLAFAPDPERAPRRRHLAAASAAAALLVALELARFLHPPVLALDGRAVGPVDPIPVDVHRDLPYEAARR